MTLKRLKFDASEYLRVLTPIERVRRRPGMYLYRLSDDVRKSRSKVSLARAVIDSLLRSIVDPAFGNAAKNVIVSLTLGGFIEIQDDGRGLPVDMFPYFQDASQPVLQLVLLGALRKDTPIPSDYLEFGFLLQIGYIASALSTSFAVTTVWEGNRYSVKSALGGLVEPLRRIGAAKSSERGTSIELQLDPSLVGRTTPINKIVARSLAALSEEHEGVSFTLMSERALSARAKLRRRSVYY